MPPEAPAISQTPAATPAAPETPAAPATPPAEGSQTPPLSPADDDGFTIDKAAAQFAKVTTPKPKEAKTPPAAKPGDKAPPETPAKPAAKPGEATKKEGDDKIDWEKADPRLKGAYFKAQREAQQKIDSYEQRIKAIESKAKEAPGDAKMVTEYQKKIAELEQELSASDYQRSPEFKQKFVERYNSDYKAAVQEISRLQLEITDAEGNVTRRPATQADFDRLRMMPPGDQDEAVGQLFGKYAPRVLARLLALETIQRDAESALQQHASTAETRAREAEAKSIREREDYERAVTVAQEELQAKHPELFGPDESDPESSEALDEGYKFVDDAMKKAPHLKPEERAAYNAVVRARAAGFMRVSLQLNRAKAELEELKAELAKYRGSDPGGGGIRGDGERPTGEQGSAAEAAEGGIDAAVAAFRK